MKRQQVERLLTCIAGLNLLVIGDLILDKYVWGKTERISPEGPVPVVEVEQDEIRLGGAGNVLNNLLALGCKVAITSVVGADEDGQRLLELLLEAEINVEGIQQVSGRITSRKTRVLANQQQMLRIDRECRANISTVQQDGILSFVERQLQQVQGVIISDYLKGVLTPALLKGLIALCRKQGVPVCVDPKGDDFSRYHGATLLTPNRREMEIAAGRAIRDESSLLQVGRKLLQDLDLKALMVTRSEEGMSLFFADGTVSNLPTQAREVFDVSGAGDTVVATIGAALAAGTGVAEAARLANLAAGIVVGKLGTSTVTSEEILGVFAGNIDRHDGKILPRKELACLLEALRRAGKTIVFTNGCFDLLHAGHVKYLQQARALGDLLVLGLNSDESIRRLKGPKRPLLEEAERAQILAALDCIDYLTIFAEDTPLELLQLVRPDILVKGGDFKSEEVVGKELVESYGGRVELIQFVDGKSTSNITYRILNRFRDTA